MSMRAKLLLAFVALLFAGCASAPPHAYSVCATQPGTEACQVERYDHVD
mgnify:FL=1|jgi:uncharacterized lipoprotein YmbA